MTYGTEPKVYQLQSIVFPYSSDGFFLDYFGVVKLTLIAILKVRPVVSNKSGDENYQNRYGLDLCDFPQRKRGAPHDSSPEYQFVL